MLLHLFYDYSGIFLRIFLGKTFKSKVLTAQENQLLEGLSKNKFYLLHTTD